MHRSRARIARLRLALARERRHRVVLTSLLEKVTTMVAECTQKLLNAPDVQFGDADAALARRQADARSSSNPPRTAENRERKNQILAELQGGRKA